MVPWSKQSYLKKERIPSVENILDLVKGIRNKQSQALFIITYLTAGRMQEIVRYDRHDEKRPSIRHSDFKIVNKNDRTILLIDLRNEKNKVKHRKYIPIPLDISFNKELWNLLVDYLNECDTQELFPFGYKKAYKILTSITDNWNPHFIRHIRLTHLVTVYGYREHQLTLYAGWTDARPAKCYLEMRWEDLLY